MKKLLSLLLISILIFSCLSFVGCVEEIESKEMFVDYVIYQYTKTDEMIKVTDVKYVVSSKDPTTLIKYVRGEYDYIVVMEGKPYFEDEDIVDDSYIYEVVSSSPPWAVEMDVPGDYVLKHKLRSGHEFQMTIQVIENRPSCEIVYDGGEKCIERNGNRFTYKYDGMLNAPSVKYIYKGEEICSLTPIQLYRISTIKKFNGTEFVDRDSGSLASDIGIFQYTYNVDDVLPTKYRNGFFAPIDTTIIVEIVE